MILNIKNEMLINLKYAESVRLNAEDEICIYKARDGELWVSFKPDKNIKNTFEDIKKNWASHDVTNIVTIEAGSDMDLHGVTIAGRDTHNEMS